MQKGIRVPPGLYPSSLLWLDTLSQAGQDLRARCRHIHTYDPDLMRQLVKDARDLLAQGDPNSCATVLICLADHCRECGDLDLACECCEQAENLFCCYEDNRHAHNQAVALYALGLVYQFLDREREAISRYDRALEAFPRACAEWMWVRDCARSRMNQCQAVVRWIRTLRAKLALAESVPLPHGSTPVRIPVFPATSAGDPLRATEAFDDWIEVEESLAGRANYALRVKGDSMVGAGINDGDLVLIQGADTWPSARRIVVVRIDGMETESVLKWYDRCSDHICLHPDNDNYPFLIVLRGWRLQEGIERDYRRRHPNRDLKFFIERSVQCVGWYHDKV